MKTVIFFTVLLLIIYSSVFIGGVLQEPDSVIEKSINIEAPGAVVFNTLIDFTHYQGVPINLLGSAIVTVDNLAHRAINLTADQIHGAI